jgi:protein phosphatase
MTGWVGIGRTDRGRVRSVNQDAFAVLNELGLWIVADGMGGRPGGDVASRLAIESLVQQAKSHRRLLRESSYYLPTLLTQLLTTAHHLLLDKGATVRELKGLGTTIVLLCIAPEPAATATVVHVGDSRAYLFREGTLTPLTRDHTFGERYVQEGILTPAQARTHPDSHILTRALGFGENTKPDYTTLTLLPEDRLLLCTDGLTKMLSDGEIAEILTTCSTSSQACDALVEAALQRGGVDNVTVLVCASTPQPRETDAANRH